MKKRNIVFLTLSIICFLIAGISIYSSYKNNKYDYSINGFYDECIEYEDSTETIIREDTVGANTNFTIRTLYTNCGHEVDEYIPIDTRHINKTYDEIKQMYPEYEIIEFNNMHITLKKNVDTNCPYHYYLKEENNRVAIYKEINNDKIELYEVLDILITSLRQNDQYLFKNGGVKIYGREKLYQFIEDFDS